MQEPARLTVDTTSVLVVDVQEKLLPKIFNSQALVNNIGFLLDACRILEVPVTATEQYPRGLGPTVPELAKRLPALRPEKLAFSCCGVPDLAARFREASRPDILVVGIETHVCVLQTVLDLVAQGFRVFVASDAVGSRYRVDHETALTRMFQAGAVLCTVEMAVFELTRIAGTPRFREISRLVQERMKFFDTARDSSEEKP
jgi:nicotinamidase-related amidase